jgi:hypothetical protein
MKFRNIAIALFLISITGAKSQVKKKVLFLGNSYTYFNNLPQLVKDVALSKGDTLVFDGNLIGGYTFQSHWNNSTTYTKINSNTWDVVVIQGQSQEPSFSPTQVMNQSYPYAKNLVDSVRAVNPCAEVMFFMTWGRKNGDASNCAAYPPLCTYAGMQARLRESYLLFADSFNASCAPVGVAWKKLINDYPSVNLYDGDESHPNINGSYLSACVFYSSIFKKNAVGATFYSSLNPTLAQNIQSVAGPIVMDSALVWNLNSQLPTADFTYSLVSGNTYQFNNTSVNATSYNWSFGSTQFSPQHTFSGNPPFTVTLSASNSCTTTAVSKPIGVTGKAVTNEEDFAFFYSDGFLIFRRSFEVRNAEFYIYNLSGELKLKFHSQEASAVMDLRALDKGIYFVKCNAADRTLKTLKFVKE